MEKVTEDKELHMITCVPRADSTIVCFWWDDREDRIVQRKCCSQLVKLPPPTTTTEASQEPTSQCQTRRSAYLPANGEPWNFCVVEVLFMPTGTTRSTQCFPDKPNCCLPSYTHVSPSLWDIPCLLHLLPLRHFVFADLHITHNPPFQGLAWSKPSSFPLGLPSQLSPCSSAYHRVTAPWVLPSYIDTFPKGELLCELSACSLRLCIPSQ